MTRKQSALEYRKTLKNKIIEIAREQFLDHGFKAVKMDDIATALGISKRTLYEIYPTKEELIFETFKSNLDNDMAGFEQRIAGFDDTMDILAEFVRLRFQQMRNVNPCLLEELHNYPRVQSYIEEFKSTHFDSAEKFYRQCQEEGYIKTDINLGLLRCLNQLLVDAFFASIHHHNYKPDDIFSTMTMMFIRSVCTPKGIERIDQMLAESTNV